MTLNKYYIINMYLVLKNLLWTQAYELKVLIYIFPFET